MEKVKKFLVNGRAVSITLSKQSKNELHFVLNGKNYQFKSSDGVKVENENQVIETKKDQVKNGFHIFAQEISGFVAEVSSLQNSLGSDSGADLGPLSPMPGKILKIFVVEGQSIKKGEPLVVMEAMKMEHTIKAGKNGKIKKLRYKVGDLVEGQTLLVDFESES
jgi:acetyl/propionyl-CoA carboxylase alpha subunit